MEVKQVVLIEKVRSSEKANTLFKKNRLHIEMTPISLSLRKSTQVIKDYLHSGFLRIGKKHKKQGKRTEPIFSHAQNFPNCIIIASMHK